MRRHIRADHAERPPARHHPRRASRSQRQRCRAGHRSRQWPHANSVLPPRRNPSLTLSPGEKQEVLLGSTDPIRSSQTILSSTNTLSGRDRAILRAVAAGGAELCLGTRAGPVPRRPLLLRPVRRPPPGSRGTDRRHDAQARRRARRRRPHPGRQALSVPGTW